MDLEVYNLMQDDCEPYTNWKQILLLIQGTEHFLIYDNSFSVIRPTV